MNSVASIVIFQLQYLQRVIEEFGGLFQSKSAECNKRSHGVEFSPVTNSIHTHAAEESRESCREKWQVSYSGGRM